MNEEQLRTALARLAERGAPDPVDVRPAVLRMRAGERRTPAGRRRIFPLAALALAATAAAASFAVWQWGDPGIRSILSREMQTTFAITPAVTAPPVASSTPERDGGGSAAPIGVEVLKVEQANGPVKVSLDWAYLDENRLVYQFTVRGLEPGRPFAWPDVIRETLADPQGNPVNEGGWGAEDRQGPETGSLTRVASHFMDEVAVPADGLDLVLTISVGGGQTFLLPTGTPDADWRPTPVEVPSAGVFVFRFHLPVHAAIRLEPALSLEAGGRVLTLQSLRIAPSYTVAVLCYPLPSSEDWMPDAVARMDGGEPVPPAAIGFLEPKEALAAAAGLCVSMEFPLAYEGPGVLALEVAALRTSPKGDEASLAAAREALRVQGIEIREECRSFSAPGIMGGGGCDVVVVAKPDGMSDEEALRRYDLAQRQSAGGPWRFEILVP